MQYTSVGCCWCKGRIRKRNQNLSQPHLQQVDSIKGGCFCKVNKGLAVSKAEKVDWAVQQAQLEITPGRPQGTCRGDLPSAHRRTRPLLHETSAQLSRWKDKGFSEHTRAKHCAPCGRGVLAKGEEPIPLKRLSAIGWK